MNPSEIMALSINFTDIALIRYTFFHYVDPIRVSN